MSDYQSDGIQKAAILLSSLPSETAGALIRRLDPAQAVKIRRELLKMRPVALDTARSVISEFIRKTEQRSSITAAPTAATTSKTGLREAQTQIQAPFPNTPADGDIPVSGAELSVSDHPSKTDFLQASLLAQYPDQSSPAVTKISDSFAQDKPSRGVFDRSTPPDLPEKGSAEMRVTGQRTSNESPLAHGQTGDHFTCLSKFTPHGIAEILKDERPFIIATLLKQFPAEFQKNINDCFPERQQKQILDATRELDASQEISPDLITVLENSLLERLLIHEF